MMKSKALRHFTGEVIGTFLMCFLGIGACCTATLFGALTGAGQVGLVWGIAIALGIYLTRNLSDAHFNPAVTFAMCLAGKNSWKDFPVYLAGQCVGALLACAGLWLMFADSIMKNLENAGLTMASNSIGSAASIFVEIYPNTTNGSITWQGAMFAEGIGVFILVLVIFSVTARENPGRPSSLIAPLFIGLTITVLINVVGPLTNAGFNPARDLMPRVWACIVGWGPIAFGSKTFETIMVYTVGPLLGAAVAALFYKYVIGKMHEASCEQAGSEPVALSSTALLQADEQTV